MIRRCRLVLLLVMLTVGTSIRAQSTFPTWVKHPEPVYSGQFFTASDVVILDERDTGVEDAHRYRMFYTCLDFLRELGTDPRALLCSATSPDGFTWTPVDAADGGAIEGLILRGREGEWDENLEGAYVLRVGDSYYLYYSAYTNLGGMPAKGFPAALALATSTDGVHFERVQSEPILAPTPGWYDNDAVYSEVVFALDGGVAYQYGMVYVGHCYTRCEYGVGTTLLGATSLDGRTWTKLPDPVLTAMPEAVPWTRDGVAEPALVIEPDSVTLFFTGVRDADRWLGMARSTSGSPFGPWDLNPAPILKPTPGSFDAGGVLAPHVLIEDGIARMWYLGVQPVEGGEYYHVGYAEAVWTDE